jgi:hypothetical protein
MLRNITSHVVRLIPSTLLLAIVAIAWACPAMHAVAAPVTWTNGNATALWATAANWSPSTPVAGDDVTLPAVIPTGGGTITLPNGATAGTLTFGNSYTLTGGQLALNGTGGPISVASGATATIGSSLNGSQGLTLSGGGTLKLTATPTLSNLTIGATIGDTVASNLQFSANATFTGNMLIQTNSATANTTTIDSGLTLKVTGSTVYLGDNSTANVNTSTVINFTGGGIFDYDRATNGIFQVGGHQTSNTFGGNNVATVDMSGLTSASFKVSTTAGTFRVGDNQTNANGSQASSGSTLTLAPTSTIIANRVSIGADSASQNSVHTLHLGSVKTEMNANTIQIGVGTGGAGTQRGSGLVDFATSTGTLKIRDAAGTGAAVLDLVNNTEIINSAMSGTMNLTGHNSDLLLSTFTLASRRNGNATTGAGNATATFNFDTGTLTATSLIASRRAFEATTNPNTSGLMTSTINLAGGTTTIGSIDLASNTSATNAGGGTTATVNINGGTVGIGAGGIVMATTSGATGNIATSTFNLTGGVVTLAGDIARTPGGVGVENTTLFLDGSTLDMGNFSIGTAAAPIGSGSGALILSKGTLKNVAQINGGAALFKTNTGTMVLAGTNSFTGDLGILNGKWLVHGTHNTAGSYALSNGTTLGGSGTVNLAASEQISVPSGAFLSPGSGYTNLSSASALNVGTLSVNGSGTLIAMNGNLQMDVVSPTSYDAIALSGTIQISSSALLEVNGKTDFTQLNFAQDLGFANGGRINLVTAGLINGSFQNFAINTTFYDANGLSVFFGQDSTSIYFESEGIPAAPEPGSLSLFGIGLTLYTMFARRRNRAQQG